MGYGGVVVAELVEGRVDDVHGWWMEFVQERLMIRFK